MCNGALQLVEAKEAGAAGVIGIVANILGNGSPVMSSFAAAIGLDAPIEVSKHSCPICDWTQYSWLDCIPNFHSRLCQWLLHNCFCSAAVKAQHVKVLCACCNALLFCSGHTQSASPFLYELQTSCIIATMIHLSICSTSPCLMLVACTRQQIQSHCLIAVARLQNSASCV